MQSLLDEVKARRQREQEALRKTLLHRLQAALPDLQTRLGFHTLYVFGSLCRTGEFRSDSDADLAVAGCPPEQFFGLQGRLEALLERPVDLLDLDCSRRSVTDLKARAL
ncbi:MAG: hypothetical protein HS115_00125 [Spirochaetales bacterium]|nr:hypothetical protein [Spirochaetales bacterium]